MQVGEIEAWRAFGEASAVRTLGGMNAPPADDHLTLFPGPAQLRRINREFVGYLRSSFPRRYYRQDSYWSLFGAAALLRMSDTVMSIMALMTRHEDGDARTLARSLYEQAVVFAWVAIDPATRLDRWRNQALKDDLARHNEAVPYGQQLLSAAEIGRAKAAVGLPQVEPMARELDKHWPSRVNGLHPPGGLLSFHGMYQLLYRVGSRTTHASIEALSPYVQLRGTPRRVGLAEPSDEGMIWYALAAPILAIATTIAAQEFTWLDEARIRRFNDRATAETIRRRERSAHAQRP
jgi:hypothetical protein